MERDALESLILKQFHRRDHWAFNELQDITNQPSAFLKEVLDQLCILIKKGQFKSTFELRPEYRISSKTTSTDATSDSTSTTTSTTAEAMDEDDEDLDDLSDEDDLIEDDDE